MLASFAAVAVLAASARAAPVAVSLAAVEAALALPNTTQTNDAVWYNRECPSQPSQALMLRTRLVLTFTLYYTLFREGQRWCLRSLLPGL